ncbi:cupredoxin domain-containing protein [Pendulispora brunnea]|uniref:Cupredoxin domain-containing protein n=1 Tax=Pendulispora brunnea TaxID=2905690 RepID=A0ABZ2KKM3_9BACT
MRMLLVGACVSSMIWCSIGCSKSDEAQVPAGGELKVEANEKGFTPSAISVKKGAPSHLVFTRTSEHTCATEVVFPDLGINKELPLNKPVSIDIPADQDKTLTFACGMNMYKGQVVVK